MRSASNEGDAERIGYITHPLLKTRLENLLHILVYGEKIPLLPYQKVKIRNSLFHLKLRRRNVRIFLWVSTCSSYQGLF